MKIALPGFQTLALYFALAAAFAVTAVSAAMHGKLSNRWGEPVDLLAAAAKLDRVPAEFGDWRVDRKQELSDDVIRMLQCTGYLQQAYLNRVTGEKVSVAVLVGPPGPMSVHTPEICYPSRNYKVVERPNRCAIEGGEPNSPINPTAANKPAKFWRMSMQSPELMGNLLHVYYAWTDGQGWQAPDEPRIKFAGRSYLYKIQVATTVPRALETSDTDPCRSFLRDFLPVLNRSIAEDPLP